MDLLNLKNQNGRRNFIDDPNKFDHMLSLFESWFRYQKHLPQFYGKSVLSSYLRACKMDLEKAKTKFERYCYLSQTQKTIYANRASTLESDLQCLDFFQTATMPRLTTDGIRISVYKFLDAKNYDIVTVLRYCTLIIDYRIHNDYNEGETFIYDLRFVGSQQYAKLFNALLLNYIKIVFDVYPARVKSVFVVTQNSLIVKGVNFCKKVLPEKIKNRIYVLRESTDLCKHISEDCLPSDYNGNEDSLANLSRNWRDLILENKEFYTRLDEMAPSGPLPKHITKYDDCLGVDGSFRKLNID